MNQEEVVKKLAIEVLEQSNQPLSRKGIYEQICQKNLHKKENITANLLWNKLEEVLRNHRESFIPIGDKVIKYWLSSRGEYEKNQKDMTTDKEIFHERNLHPLLARFIRDEPYFNAYCKTIYHEQSKNSPRGHDQWLYPDVIAVQFSHLKYKNLKLDLMKDLNIALFSIFSFEIKKTLTLGNFTNCLSQTINNSLWANEAYLIAIEIDKELIEQIKIRKDIPIGIIELNANEISKSTIHQYSQKRTLDPLYMDKLFDRSPDFAKFFRDIQGVLKGGKTLDSDFDKILDDKELKKHINQYKIKNS